MPCLGGGPSWDCEYRDRVGRLLCLIDEARGIAGADYTGRDASRWGGNHPGVADMHEKHRTDVWEEELWKQDITDLEIKLCALLQDADVTKFSLEMQIWWRDHKAIDKKRIENEMRAQKTVEDKKAALEKLTPYERRLLGLKDE